MSCRDLNLVLYAPLFTALSRATMPPFSSALLPLSLKEIGGLGPTEGDCVSRLPTIVTLRVAPRRQWDISQICLCIALFSSFFSSLINFCPELLPPGYSNRGNCNYAQRKRICFSSGEKKRDGGVRKTESHRDRDKRVQLYFLFIQALFETVGRNRDCIHLLFYTSTDPLPPPSLQLCSPSIP